MQGRENKPKKKSSPHCCGPKIVYRVASANPEEVQRRLDRAYAVIFEFALKNYQRKKQENGEK